MKKTLISSLIVAALFLSGCNEKQQTASSSAQSTIEQHSISAIFSKEKVLFDKKETIPVKPSIETNKATEEEPRAIEINWHITTLETGIPWLDTLLLKKSKGEIEDFAKAFDKTRQELSQEPDISSSNDFIQSTDFIGQREKLATFAQNTYVYTGGAHGMPSIQYFNIDLTTQHILQLSDLFDDNMLNKVKEALWTDYTTNSEEIFIEKENFMISNQFYLGLGGITFVYQPYEIGSYAEGFKELNLSWWQIQDLLKPEFKQKNYFPMQVFED
ncbi:RsiV family protein [Rodentibacter caecimuris]|uniref:DUF3298 domain-containing protein n=1 Tax=Rodentibacter caecimuris TaxID=1796644 RepID=A0ABX3KXW2_9PAST|nr:hypothetical protein BKG89_04145 [Rodentibacter heylii]